MTSGSKIQQGLEAFCTSMRQGEIWRYKYSDISPPTLSASAFAGLVLGLTGALESLSKLEKTNWIEYLQSCQDEKTGLFINPEFRSQDRRSEKHSDELLHAHHSTFVMGALSRLGAKPIYPLSWVHSFREPGRMRAWIESLRWDINAWVVGNWTYDMGCAMGMDYLVTGDEACLEGMNAYFDWFDEHQLASTGWWDLRKGSSPLFEQQFGGYHTLMVYWMFDRPIGMADRIIDSSLSLQHDDGMFEPEGGGGCCQDMDVIDPLVTLGLVTDYRTQEITEALNRALHPILAKNSSDGGFYDTLAWERAEFGWQFNKAERGASDLCSCLFYGFTLALIGEYLKESDLMDVTWHHHQSYYHCVHRPARIR